MGNRLIELLSGKSLDTVADVECVVDYLLANGCILPPCKCGDIVYAKYSGTNEIEYYVIDKVSHLGSNYFSLDLLLYHFQTHCYQSV